MIRRWFSRWFVRLAFLGCIVVLLIIQGWAGALLGWAVFGYLLWRAFPAVSRDFRRLWRGGIFKSSTSSGVSRF